MIRRVLSGTSKAAGVFSSFAALSRLLGIGSCTMAHASTSKTAEYYRADGVRITHDPYAPGMVEKYGAPGTTDNEGFDPYRDTVGPGIYGGVVERDALGEVKIGKQYQNHNPRPGPIYAGGGYTPMSQALRYAGTLNHGTANKLTQLLTKYPELAVDISTGGAQPLHMAGMGKDNQEAASVLIEAGGDIEALDTYGMTPLHRMASNNLAVGARALLVAGADPNGKGQIGATPMDIARDSAAREVMAVLREFAQRRLVDISSISVLGAGVATLNGWYLKKSADQIPEGFDAVCRQQRWETGKMWAQLNGAKDWFGHENGAYIYFNQADKKWWIDEPGGNGVYTSRAGAPPHAVPAHGWDLLDAKAQDRRLPSVLTFREGGNDAHGDDGAAKRGRTSAQKEL